MDNKLNDRAIKMLNFAPFFLLLFGFWQLGNRQIFHNEPALIEFASQVQVTNHQILYLEREAYTQWLFFGFLAVFILHSYFVKAFQQIYQSFRFRKTGLHKYFDSNWHFVASVDEKLGNYWRCLSGLDQKQWYTRETYLQNKLKIRTLDDYNFAQLGSYQRGDKCITSVCNYDIIQNPFYADSFFYTKMTRRRQQFLHETSDVVSRVLNLGEERVFEEGEDQQESFKIQTKASIMQSIRAMVLPKTDSGLQDKLRNAIQLQALDKEQKASL
mmetsp:Transcript_10117/g.15446  ORF Transcript_10117/g.15446 Transcript_10117/m.15446 type:complete len:271 (-) Transcript_10117:36-848(-)